MLSEEIWADLRTRLRNLRADMVGQWQGDIDNVHMAQTITLLNSASERWEFARPPAPVDEQPFVQPPTLADVSTGGSFD